MILFIILILIVFISSRRIEVISIWYKMIVTRPYNYYALLGLLVIGFFAQLDYTKRWGCVLGGEYVFGFRNVLFSLISIQLILTSFFLRPRNLKLFAVIVELTFWIFKFFYYKGGYVVGIGAAPDPVISFYDSGTLALRLFIICELLKPNIKTVYILICTLIIIAIKVFVFPTQLDMIVESEKSKKRANFTKEKLLGEWTGIYEFDSTYMGNKTHILDTTRIRFDTNIVTIFNFKNTDSIRLCIEFDFEFGGYMHNRIKDDWKNYYDFWIQEITNDSLRLVLRQSIDNYKFKAEKNSFTSTLTNIEKAIR